MLSRAGSPDVCRCESFICDHVCFVPVKCVSLVCFNRYQFQSLYDPLSRIGEMGRFSGGEKELSLLFPFFFSSFLFLPSILQP